MARIDLDCIKEISKLRNSIHGKVVTTYTTFQQNGETFLQIDTYGSSQREHTEKISQSFQIDQNTAVFLRTLLQETFNL